MRILFVHQNAPGQFGRLAATLAARGHDVAFLGQHARQEIPKVRFETYKPEALKPIHPLLADLNRNAENGRQVFSALRRLANDNWIPELVIGHDGWGEMSFVKDALPQAKVASYFEFFYRSSGQDVGFDPAYPQTERERVNLRTRNITNLIGLDAADTLWSPTQWQRSVYPAAWQRRMNVIHDGIDTDSMTPAAGIALEMPNGERIGPGTPLITYVARNLEPYRGFHIFMKALPRLLAVLPNARVAIVGGDEVSYGRKPPSGQTWRAHLTQGLALDPHRVFFLGRVTYPVLRALFQASAAHVYLTYPFVLSWSLLEAMACGAAVVASRTAPVTEAIADNENGLLFDFFDADALVERVVEAVGNGAGVRQCRAGARITAVERYDFKRVCLPAQLKLLSDTVGAAL